MPYAIAHPAAIIPLHRWLGRYSVPSALAIGSVIPDTWYFVPFLGRPDTHTVHGALLYCVPLALFAYVLYHLLFKQPLLALFPPRLAAKLRAWTPSGLPEAPWHAVAVSALAGVLTHVVWDSFTHEGLLSARYPLLEATLLTLGGYELRVLQLLQHSSTLAGAAFLAWWIRGKLLRGAEPSSSGKEMAGARCLQGAVLAALLAVPAAVFAHSLPGLWAASGIEALRAAVRGAAISAASAFALVFMAYCLLWRCRRLLPWYQKTTS